MRPPTTLLLIACAGACTMLAPTGAYLAPARALQQNPGAADRLSDADLEELLAPIALYPDPLLANVLTAACYPDELAAAAKAGGNDSRIDAADWEPSVKAVAKIPDALAMLTDYPDWTTAIGEAFILQSQDVMSAVQRLRARAYANGALESTEQQVVSTQGDTIIIQPAQPEIIYVPTYEPSQVYVEHYDSGDVVAAGVIGFGLGVATGAIIANNVDCDWWGGGCCYGCGWGYHGDYNGGHNTKIKIDTGGGDINIGNTGGDRVNNIRNDGNKWQPNNAKISNSMREGRPTSLNNYKGAGSGRGNPDARVPKRAAGSRPVAERPAPRPSTVNRAAAPSRGGAAAPQRPAAQPTQRPASMDRPAAPKTKPSIPPASSRPPAARSSGGTGTRSPSASRPSSDRPSASRPSAYNSSGGSKAASRGASSRGSAGMSRSGGGSRGGGGGRR